MSESSSRVFVSVVDAKAENMVEALTEGTKSTDT
jgi:hypothetical protein